MGCAQCKEIVECGLPRETWGLWNGKASVAPLALARLLGREQRGFNETFAADVCQARFCVE